MKTRSKILLSVLALAAATAAPLASAQDASTRPEHREQRMGPGPRGDRLKMLSEHLGLTADQKAKLQPILKAERDALEALRDDRSLTREARRDKMREIMESHAAQVRAVLTPEQQAKLDALREKAPRGAPGLRRDRGE